MHESSAGPRRAREISHLWIGLRDGTRLSARLWLPEGAELDPVPAILEAVPYGHADGTLVRDATVHPALAARGFACLRLDLRGSGQSEGLFLDEYLPREQDDILEVIDWLACQPWCNGAIGMLGLSWGGFAGLQVAARRPAPLRAVATVCSTDDRYGCDIHYRGGCLLNENTSWGAAMLAFQARPPDPQLVGPAWREMWRQRLEAMPFFPALWLEHRVRDAYWKHGSVCEDYGAIAAAVLAVGGWADGYHGTVARLLAGLRAPVCGIVGPWSHEYPHLASPGPQIDFVAELARFYRQHLAGEMHAAEEVPPLRYFVVESAPPCALPTARRGFWRTSVSWPPPEASEVAFALSERGLRPQPARDRQRLRLATPQTLGCAGGRFLPMWGGPEGPTDQRPDDALSLTFDSRPFDRPVEILGAPRLELELRSDCPHAQLIARLCDVAPDGASTLVSWGCLDLTHRDRHERIEALVPGRPYRFHLPLDDLAWRLLPGHRLRLALSTTYWPMLWPSPWRPVLEIDAAASRLVLPLAEPEDANWAFAPPPPPERLPIERLRAARHRRRITVDAGTGTTITESFDDFGRERLIGSDLERDERMVERYAIRPDRPLSARASVRWRTERARGSWRVETRVAVDMRADQDGLLLRGTILAHESGGSPHQRQFTAHFPHPLSPRGSPRHRASASLWSAVRR
ncbi:Cocaine esterase [bacterium HR40]|nr:Cocaine esterase [bacterium HR40]